VVIAGHGRDNLLAAGAADSPAGMREYSAMGVLVNGCCTWLAAYPSVVSVGELRA
jgi:hypothetical protein